MCAARLAPLDSSPPRRGRTHPLGSAFLHSGFPNAPQPRQNRFTALASGRADFQPPRPATREAEAAETRREGPKVIQRKDQHGMSANAVAALGPKDKAGLRRAGPGGQREAQAQGQGSAPVGKCQRPVHTLNQAQRHRASCSSLIRGFGKHGCHRLQPDGPRSGAARFPR